MAKHNLSILQELEDLVRSEERRVEDSFEFERRIGLLEIARSMDYAFIYSRWIKSLDATLGQLIAYGLHKVLNLFVDNSCVRPGAPLFPSNQDIQSWADSILQHCGRIGYGEYILELCQLGLANLAKADNDTYELKLTATQLGAEQYDKENADWLSTLISQMQKKDLEQLHTTQEQILSEVAHRVGVWRKHFIQYTTSPQIDAYYERVGLLVAQQMIGNDSFPKDTHFGGIEFSLYCSSIVIMIGWARKHLDSCFELLKKQPNLNPRNILTIHQSYAVILDSLSTALEIDQASAAQVLQALTLTPENKSAHCSVPANMITPVYIKFGANTVLCPLWGVLSNPFFFLLNELRNIYPSDWDRAVNMREQAFRHELYQLFPLQRFHKIDRSVKLKINGNVITDIDAVVLDRQTGTVGLFQLKWQDFIGNSLIKRESQKVNLLSAANRWIERVEKWLHTSDLQTISQAFGVSQDEAMHIQRYRLFVIARNAAHFSGEGSPDPRAVWAQWYEFIRVVSDAISKHKILADPIEIFYQTLKENSLPVYETRSSTEELRIGTKTIKIYVSSS